MCAVKIFVTVGRALQSAFAVTACTISAFGCVDSQAESSISQDRTTHPRKGPVSLPQEPKTRLGKSCSSVSTGPFNPMTATLRSWSAMKSLETFWQRTRARPDPLPGEAQGPRFKGRLVPRCQIRCKPGGEFAHEESKSCLNFAP